MFELRKYQEEGVKAGLEFISTKGDKKGIIVAPTGSGKSLLIAGIANSVSTPILVLQPSKELLVQNYGKYTSYGNTAFIYSASLKMREIGHVTFATIGSIKNEAARFRELGVKLILVDEAHIGGAGTGMMNKFLKQLGQVKIIGLTATPIILMNTMQGPMLKMLNRTRKSFYNQIVHITQVKEVVEGGYWAKLVYEQVKIDESKLEFNSSRSEYSEESLREMYKENNLQQKIIDKVEELRRIRRSILVFVPSVDEAIELSKKIRGSQAVWGNMPGPSRTMIIEDFKERRLQIVINVYVLSIGFDFPGLDAVIDATATASFGRYYQKLGRVCRPDDSKQDSLIVDMCGNYKRFGQLENLMFKNHPGIGWGMFTGNKLLTEVLLDGSEPIYIKEVSDTEPQKVFFTFGKYKGKPIQAAPKNYLHWLMDEFTFNENNKHISVEIKRLLKN